MEQQTKHFACKDVGYDCTWELQGISAEQMLPIIEKHAAEVHNLTHFKPEAVEHVRDAIRATSEANGADLPIDRTAPAGSANSLGAQSVRDGRPGSDNSVVEAIDEEGPLSAAP